MSGDKPAVDKCVHDLEDCPVCEITARLTSARDAGVPIELVIDLMFKIIGKVYDTEMHLEHITRPPMEELH